MSCVSSTPVTCHCCSTTFTTFLTIVPALFITSSDMLRACYILLDPRLWRDGFRFGGNRYATPPGVCNGGFNRRV